SIGVGMLAFNAGVSRGLALAPAIAATAPAAPGAPAVPAVPVVGWYPYWYHPYGFHPFGFVFPLLFLFLFFGIVRRAMWGWGPRWHPYRYGYGGYGPGCGGAPQPPTEGPKAQAL